MPSDIVSFRAAVRPRSSALFWFATSAPAADDPFKETRAAFVQAYVRANCRTRRPGRPDSEELRTYPLYSVSAGGANSPRAVAPAATLESVDQRAATFLAYYDRSPSRADLRRAWLESLAERDQWELFLEHYRDASASDALRCQSFVARIELDRTEGLEADIAAQWLTPQSLPECEQPSAGCARRTH